MGDPVNREVDLQAQLSFVLVQGRIVVKHRWFSYPKVREYPIQ